MNNTNLELLIFTFFIVNTDLLTKVVKTIKKALELISEGIL